MFGEIRFEPFGKFTSREHDVSSTAFTFKPDIRAEPGHDPFIGAARMLFTEAEMVFKLKVREHISPRVRESS
jgi:hypothetical protein